MKFIIVCPNCENADLEEDIDKFQCMKCNIGSFGIDDCEVRSEECE